MLFLGVFLSVKSIIFQLLDIEDSVLVFLNDKVKKSYLAEYVKDKQVSILASKAISFETFSSYFFTPGDKACTQYHKAIFLSEFLEENNELKLIYNDKCKVNKLKFVTYFSSILSSLAYIDSSLIKQDIFDDLLIMKNAYLAFLDKQGLYDESYLPINKISLDRPHYLIAPDAEVTMLDFLSKLDYDTTSFKDNKDFICVKFFSSDISLCTYPLESKENFTPFTNTRNELTYLFEKLNSLREEDFSNILISSPDGSSLMPYLQKEANKYDISLNPEFAIEFKDTIAGTLLYHIETIYEDYFSFEALTSLFYQSNLDFKDKESINNIHNIMIEKGILISKHDAIDEVELSLKDTSLEFYSKFKYYLNTIVETNDLNTFRTSFYSFLSLLEDYKQYSSVLDLLAAIDQFAQSANELNFVIKDSIFYLFKSIVYTSSASLDSKEGLRYSSFASSYLEPYKYHFAIALDEDNTKSIVNPLSFLEPYELTTIFATDTRAARFKYFFALSSYNEASGSQVTYSQSKLLPLIFDSKKVVSLKRPKDKLKSIDNAIRAAKEFDNQLIPIEHDVSRLSYSAMQDYLKCNRSYYLKHRLDLKQLSAYSVQFEIDHLTLGSILHKAFENFFKNLGDNNKILSEDTKEECIELLGKEIKSNFENEASLNTHDKFYNISKYEKLAENFVNSSIDQFGSLEPINEELRLLEDYKGVPFISFIDFVARTASGGIALIDYKKGWANSESYQLLIYKNLFEEANEKLTKEASVGIYYYSIEYNEFVAPEEGLQEDLDKDLKVVWEGIKNNQFDKTSDYSNCLDCDFAQVCRRWMKIQ